MAAIVTCPKCDAAIRPPGGRAENVTRCPWCDADLRPAPAPPPKAPPPPPKAERPRRTPRPAPPPADDAPAAPAAPREGGPEVAVAAGILGVSAVLAVGAFFAARQLMLLAG